MHNVPALNVFLSKRGSIQEDTLLKYTAQKVHTTKLVNVEAAALAVNVKTIVIVVNEITFLLLYQLILDCKNIINGSFMAVSTTTIKMTTTISQLAFFLLHHNCCSE